MNPVVLAHRKALEAYEDAKKTRERCGKNSCKCGPVCDSDVYLAHAEEQLQIASEALKLYNAQVVALNDAETIRKRKERDLLNQKREKRLERIEREQAIRHANEIAEKSAKKQMSKKKQIKKYKRSELTRNRYDHHKSIERLSDAVIAEMYDIPLGSFTAIKKKLLENDAPETAAIEKKQVVQLKEEKSSDAEEQPVPESNVIALSEHIKVVSERDGLKEQLESLTVMFNQLAKESSAALDESERANDLKVETIKALEQDIAALQAQNCGDCETYKQNLQDIIASNQSLIGRAGELTHRNSELAAKYRELEIKYNASQIQHEEAIEAYEDKLHEYETFHKDQMKQWRAYERMILGRNLVLSTEVDKLENAVESYEVIEAQAANQISNVVDLKAAE